MNQTYQNQKMLNWLNSEKSKDLKDLEIQKKLFAEELKKIKKDNLFPKPKKLTLWQKIKKIVLGI